MRLVNMPDMSYIPELDKGCNGGGDNEGRIVESVYINCADRELPRMIKVLLNSHLKEIDVKFVDSEEEADTLICDNLTVLLEAIKNHPNKSRYIIFSDEELPPSIPTTVYAYGKNMFLREHKLESCPFKAASW